MDWPMLLNDKIPDCGVAACGHAIQLWTGKAPSDEQIQIANDRFSGADYPSKALWGWWQRGIGGHKLGGFATIKPDQIADVVARFGCAYVSCSAFHGVTGGHGVLAIPGGKVVSWGAEYPISDCVIDGAFAIAPKFSPILIWWALRNNPRWFLFLAPLWWPQ